MPFFYRANNFIISGPNDEASTQGDPRETANQALARAHAILDNVGRIQPQVPAAFPGTSSLQLSTMQNQALLTSGSSGLEIERALAGQDLVVNSGGLSFAGNMGGMSADQKRHLDEELADMRRRLDERKARKAQRIANGEGRYGRQSGQDRGGIKGPPGQVPQQTLPTANPMAQPPTLGGFTGGPPPAPFLGPPPDFNPNNPEFQQFLEFKKQMGGPNFLPPPSAISSVPTGPFPPYVNMPPPPGFVPQMPTAIFPSYGGMPGVIPPPLQPNFTSHDPRKMTTDFPSGSGYKVNGESGTQFMARSAKEAPKEDEQDEVSQVDDAEISKEKEKRQRSSLLKNLFPK